MSAMSLQKKKQESKFYNLIKVEIKFLYFYLFCVNSGEDWLSLIVVVRVVVSVTEVLLCLCLCWGSVVVVASVDSAGGGSDV